MRLTPSLSQSSVGTGSAAFGLASLLLAPALFLLGLSFSGCDAVDESLLSEFRAQVDGPALQDTLVGEAVYSVIETDGGPRFILGLFADDLYASDYDDYQFLTFRRDGRRLGVGAYAIDGDVTDDDVVAVTYADVTGADNPLEARGPILRGRSGVLTITQVDSYGFLSGSFRLDAEGLLLPNRDNLVEATGSGVFEARYVDPSVLTSLGVNLGLTD